jgi:hypothetical protein
MYIATQTGCFRLDLVGASWTIVTETYLTTTLGGAMFSFLTLIDS